MGQSYHYQLVDDIFILKDRGELELQDDLAGIVKPRRPVDRLAVFPIEVQEQVVASGIEEVVPCEVMLE